MFHNDLTDPNQNGFTSSKCCMYNSILTVVEYWTHAITVFWYMYTDVTYHDITKAFDTIPHVKLLSKLKAYS